MTTKVLEIKDYLHLVCIKDSNNKNPYRLYLLFHEKDRYGYWTEHKRQLVSYGDMHSVICFIADLYRAGIQYKPVDIILAWNKQYHNNA